MTPDQAAPSRILPAMRRARLLLSLTFLLAGCLAACADAIPHMTTPTAAERDLVSPQRPQPAGAVVATARAPRDPDRPIDNDAPIRFDIHSYREVRRFADQMLETLDEERLWCERQPEVAELRAMLDAHDPETVWRSLLSPAEGEDLRAVDIIAGATAEARGIALRALPPVFLVSRTDLRRYACLYEDIWEYGEEADAGEDDGGHDDGVDEQVAAEVETEQVETQVGLAASRLAQLLGQSVEDYGDLEQSWLSATLVAGWYEEIDGAHELAPGEDGIGEVVLVSSPPMPAFFTSVVSHELVHVLQDQWLDWRLHDLYRDAQTTDALNALRWIVEGDATLNELYEDAPPLRQLLADIEWGPEEHAETDLWIRAYEALTPQESENLFAAYEQGSSILSALRGERGQEAIDELLLDPPESSEQLIHAEKLERGEQPIDLVDLPRLRELLLPASEWRAPIVDRMGEQWLRSLITSASKRTDIARKTAAGWGSDQMALWTSKDGETEVVTWQIVFDDPEEHREGLSGLRRWFFSHTANEAQAAFANMLSWDNPGGGGAARLVTRPRAVWLVASNDPAVADDIANGIRTRIWTNYWSADRPAR